VTVAVQHARYRLAQAQCQLVGAGADIVGVAIHDQERAPRKKNLTGAGVAGLTQRDIGADFCDTTRAVVQEGQLLKLGLIC